LVIVIDVITPLAAVAVAAAPVPPPPVKETTGDVYPVPPAVSEMEVTASELEL
jgi:hypothetical protein